MKTENRIIYSKDFDREYAYEGKDLGAVWTKEETVFTLWSPWADEIFLRLYEGGDSRSAKESYQTVKMQPEEKGIFRKKVSGDLHGTYYDYEIVRGMERIITADPYALSCGCNGARSMVVDLRRTDPEGFSEDKAPKLQNEQIIYELHIKDFSYDPGSGIPEEYRGKFKAFTVERTDGELETGVSYLQKLGITHVHLLPFYDFAALDEGGDKEQFNWGYDPLNYNVPEGSFATDPYHGEVRIRECKEMIQALHKAGIRVVMDVVYNHTFSEDSWLERTVPGYFCRRLEDGTLSDGSACGNDMAAGRAMVDQYILDSVMYWAREYHIDGFRFDLMGLLSVELMNRIRRELDTEFGKGEILLYGEPWRAAFSPMEEGTHPALKENIGLLDENVAVFSDDIRDVIKGHVFYAKEPGFVNGDPKLGEKILYAVSAWRKGGADIVPKSCSQIVSYISAHDNFTLWDKLVLTIKQDKVLYTEEEDGIRVYHNPQIFLEKDEKVLAANKLAAMIYFTCQGYVFFQAGEEFGRTKFGDDNSYRSDPKINMLCWKQTQTFADLLSYYKGLIRLRKHLPGLYDKSPSACDRIFGEKIYKDGVVSFMVDNAGKETEESSPYDTLFVIFNASLEAEEIELPKGEWYVLADGKETDCCKKWNTNNENKIPIPPCSGIIAGKK